MLAFADTSLSPATWKKSGIPICTPDNTLPNRALLLAELAFGYDFAQAACRRPTLCRSGPLR